MMPVKRTTATLVSRVPLNDSFFELDFIVKEACDIQAGQYVSLKVGTVFKPYSIAAFSHHGQRIKLCIDTNPGGIGSQFAKTAPLKTQIDVLIPLGKFVLSSSKQPALFVATGSGIAPFKAMIHDLISQSFSEPIHLLWGMRYAHQLFWLEDWKTSKNNNDLFQYTWCLSKEPQNPGLGEAYFYGRVTDYLNSRSDWRGWQIYICGNGNMIQDVKNVVLHKEIQESDIHYEKYF